MKKNIKKVDVPKTVILVNPMNNETWCCNDYNNVKLIEGDEFLTVYKPESSHRTFLMKKSALKLLEKKNYPML